MSFVDKMAGLLAIVLLAVIAAVSCDMDSCNPDKMTVYRMVLHTYWTREKFPKHYPDWRPPAQWSKIYGKLKYVKYIQIHSQAEGKHREKL